MNASAAHRGKIVADENKVFPGIFQKISFRICVLYALETKFRVLVRSQTEFGNEIGNRMFTENAKVYAHATIRDQISNWKNLKY